MNRNGKKVLILVLTLSLAATFVAPLPVIRGQDESPDVAWVDDWKEFERDSTVYFEGVKATTGVSAFATIHEAISIGNIPAGAVKDTADNPLPEEVSFSFTTMAEPDTTAPEVESTDPANGAVDVPPDKVIKVTFTEEVVKGNAFADIVLKNAEGKELSTKVETPPSTQ